MIISDYSGFFVKKLANYFVVFIKKQNIEIVEPSWIEVACPLGTFSQFFRLFIRHHRNWDIHICRIVYLFRWCFVAKSLKCNTVVFGPFKVSTYNDTFGLVVVVSSVFRKRLIKKHSKKYWEYYSI